VAQALVGAAAAHGIRPIDPVDTPELHREELRHAAAFLEERGIQAEDRHVDLIVVGTREAGLLERFLDPSVSGAVQRRAHCDVLVVH
jgi:nucleotide-binding universal stress UspA family protein